MITWLIGENSFEIREALQALKADFSGTLEQKDANELVLADLPELLMGVSLFATERLVIINDITLNKTLWERLPDWLPRVSDAIHLVCIDTKPDKRTLSYKALKAAAHVQEFPAWTDRDIVKAEAWVLHRAESRGVQFSRPLAKHLVARVGLDQWQLAQALDVLSLLDETTPEAIDAVIPANLSENIFQLFETALEGKAQHVAAMLQTLALQEDPYALFALLSSQASTLATVAFAEEGSDPAKDFATHPFVVSKLKRHATRLGKAKVAAIIELFALTDADLKRSRAEPWLLLEKLLVGIIAL